MEPIPDYLILGTVGRLGVAVFAVYLASMIFESRRGSKADVSLAAVLLTWGIVEAIDAYRYSQQLTFLPFYISRASWIASLIAEAVAIYFIHRERRAAQRGEVALVSRQEQAVERQEEATAKQEQLLDLQRTDMPHDKRSSGQYRFPEDR